MLNQILDLSKIEAGEMDWELEPLDLNEAVAHAVGTNRALFDEKGIAFTQEAAPTPVRVVADRDRLIQVITNLLSNAAKFTSEGGIVHVRTGREHGQAIVEVEDSGIGIPQDQRDAVFEKFRQVGDPLTAKPQGTGLGLPISREIVERHGGTLAARDTALGGACFRMTLPLASETRRPRTPTRDRPPPRQRAGSPGAR
jgi:signal transduction histidine kinase